MSGYAGTSTNDSPVAISDNVITNEDIAIVTGNVTINDTDVDSDTLIITDYTNRLKLFNPR